MPRRKSDLRIEYEDVIIHLLQSRGPLSRNDLIEWMKLTFLSVNRKLVKRVLISLIDTDEVVKTTVRRRHLDEKRIVTVYNIPRIGVWMERPKVTEVVA